MGELYQVMWAGAGEVRMHPRYCFDNRNRQLSAEIYCIQRTRSGRVFFEWKGQTHFIAANCAMIFSHNEDSRYGYPAGDKTPYVGDFLSLKGPGLAEILEAVRARAGGEIPMPAGAESTRLYNECIHRFKARNFRNRYQESAAVYELLMALQSDTQQANQTRNPISAAHELILSRFNTPLTVGEIAAYCNLSREHFSRAYRARYRRSPGQTLRQLRLQRAAEMLLHTHATVWQIAEQCGYRDADSFARAFSREKGRWPEAYRQKKRAARPKK